MTILITNIASNTLKLIPNSIIGYVPLDSNNEIIGNKLLVSPPNCNYAILIDKCGYGLSLETLPLKLIIEGNIIKEWYYY